MVVACAKKVSNDCVCVQAIQAPMDNLSDDTWTLWRATFLELAPKSVRQTSRSGTGQAA